MAMGDQRYGSGDPAAAAQAQARQMRGFSGAPPSHTSGGRRLGRLDNGTVALALGGMALYWLMPALLARGRKGRRVVRPARRPQRPTTAPPAGDGPETPQQ